MDDLSGITIGRYHIIEMIGKGGMAFVYKAYDTFLDRDVAVKIIRTDLFGTSVIERLKKRFELEAKTLATLNHDNIVKVFDYGDYDGTPYLVMEFLPGTTLKQHMSKPITWEKAIEIILPIARALKYAHDHKPPVLHRDVKPSNIIITNEKKPFLSDFGIAKVLSSQEDFTLTGTGVGIGTPEYMAPEQGKGDKIDGRVDVYSLGIVLFEMITGKKPFTADTPMAVILKQISDPLPRPKQYIRDLPDEVEKLLFKALAKDPNARFQKMDDFIVALDRIVQKEKKKSKIIKTKEIAKKYPIGEGETVDLYIPNTEKNSSAIKVNEKQTGSPQQKKPIKVGQLFVQHKKIAISSFLFLASILIFFYFQKNPLDLGIFVRDLVPNNFESSVITKTLSLKPEISENNDIQKSPTKTFTPGIIVTLTKNQQTLTQITSSPTITKLSPTNTYFSPTVVYVPPTNTFVPIPTNTPIPLPTNTPVPLPTNTSAPAPTQVPTEAPTATEEVRPPTPTPP